MPTARQAKARLAAHIKHGNVDEVDDARRELHAAVLEAHVRRIVEAAPPLTAEQRAKIAAILLSARPRAGGDRAA